MGWWLFDDEVNCPIVDFIGHLETIDFDVQYIMNLINDNKVILDYYVENGEYWQVNTFGSSLKRVLYNNSLDGELGIRSLADIYRNAKDVSDIDVQRWTSELYDSDFRLFGYDKGKVDDNLRHDIGAMS